VVQHSNRSFFCFRHFQAILISHAMLHDSVSICQVHRSAQPTAGITEIRVFPKGLPSLEHTKLLDLCIRGIRNCINLRSCAWTRDGSLGSTILQALQQCPQLKELEINGHDSGYFNPIILAQFSKLSRISLIMPSAQVVEVLPSWISTTGPTLRNLTIICKVRECLERYDLTFIYSL
jgi:hypothetical protein